ncbi:unnamed protein product [Spirodela intermedia]|uniref:Uncharacterized protein n=1 Tax=Spirodela intermedia TaxID=51605 RepID=A0A7I8IQ20_SPIIN|nr:unnamed protein product [Spirodela intermedia]CAA6659882.1 unnamed protein product [Spirodela intermedia]
MEMQTEKMGFSGKEGVEEEGGVELNLCLSIGGGTSRMAPKAEEGETKGSAGLPPSSPLPHLTLYRRGDAVDRRRRREMQLLRRPEAHEQNMGIQRRRRNGATPSPSPAAGFCSLSPSLDDLLAPESKEDDRSRVSSREDGVEDAGSSNQKTREDPERGLDSEVKPELLPNANGSPNADVDYGPTFCPNSLNPNLPVLAPRPYPVMAMQSPFLQLQCLQVANGFGIPYLMPWWAPAMPPAAALPAVNEVRPMASSLAGKAVGTGGWMPHGSRSCSAMSDNVSHSFRGTRSSL